MRTGTAEVRNGTALDAVLISLVANAEHGKRHEAGDYRKAYDIACRYKLVPPAATEVAGVGLPAVAGMRGTTSDACYPGGGRSQRIKYQPRSGR